MASAQAEAAKRRAKEYREAIKKAKQAGDAVREQAKAQGTWAKPVPTREQKQAEQRAEAARKEAERKAQAKQQVKTEAEETKTALSTYMQSEERTKKEEAHKKQELSRFTQQLLGGNADIMQPQMLRDEKEAQLRKEADKAGKTQAALDSAQASQERARETTSTEEADLAEIQTMTPEERRQLDEYIFNREQKFYRGFDPTKSDLMMPQMPVVSPLEQKYGKKRLDELAESQSRKNQRDISEKALQDAAASAGGSGWDAVGHSALAVLAGASSGIGKGLDYLKDKALGTERYDGMDPNGAGSFLGNYAGTVQGTVADKIGGDTYDEEGNLIEDGGWLRKGLSMGYQGLMSAAESSVRALLFGGSAGGAAVAAADTFVDGVNEAMASGATQGQATSIGLAKAMVEFITEKIPMDRLTDLIKGGGKSLLRNMAAQAGEEATTEVASYAASILAEWGILREKSGYQQKIAKHILDGVPPEEAKKLVDREVLNEATETAIVSGFAGAFGGLSGTYIGNKVEENAQGDLEQVIQPEESQLSEQQGESPLSVQQDPVGQETESAPVMPEEAAGAPETRELDVVTQAVQQAQQNREAVQNAQQEPTLAQQLTPEQRVQEAVKGVRKKEEDGVKINTPETGGVWNKLRSYTQSEKENWKYSKRIVLCDGIENFRQFVSNALTSKEQTHKKMYFGAITQNLATEIKTATGVNVEGYNLSLGEDEIRKIKKSHGNEKTETSRGQRPVTEADYLVIPDIVQNADSIKRSDSDYEGKPALEFRKRNGNELTTVVAVVSDKRLDVFVQTAYINKKGGSIATPESVQADSFTPVATGGTAPVSEDPQGQKTVHPGATPKAESAGSSKEATQSTNMNSSMNIPAGSSVSTIPQLPQEVNENPAQASDNLLNGQQPAPEGMKGTGAAEQNFTGKAAYADLLQKGNVQRDRPGDVRPVEVPKKDGAGRRVTELAGNAYGAKATPDYMANEIESLIQDGKLGFDTRSNQESLRRAADALEGNTEGVKAQITENLANDKVQDGDIEKAMLLYVKNANSKDKADQEAAAQILVQLGKMANITGRNLQILGMLRRMTPEGQLLYIEKSARSMVDSLNQKRSAREKAVPRRKEQAERAVEAVNRAKEQTAQAVKTAAKRVRYQKGKVVIEGNQHGEPFVFEYAQKVGEALAQGIERRATKGPKGKTFLQEIAENLQRFANEKVDTPKQQKRTLTATELLRDYIQNQDFYIAAWENAQQNLRDSGNKNQKLDEFMNTGIGVDANNSAKNKIFAKALTEAAIASGETKRMIETQKALGFRNMADPVAEKLISQTGATGDTAETIRAAARDYISQVEAGIEQDPKSRSESSIVEGKIRAALQDVEKTLDKLARSDGKTKVDTGKQVVELLTKKYGFDQADASHVADVVKAEYQRMVREKSKKILAQSFKERKPREQKTSDQIFDELANLGAFDADSEFNQAAAEKWLKTKDTYIEPELAKAYLDAKTDDEKEAALDNIYKDVASRIPATLGEKWDAWRNMAMLLNPKTHIRNMGATGSFLPFVEVKRVIGAALEKALLDEEQRTKAVLGSDKRSKALLKWAKEDAKKPKVIERLGQSGTTGDNARSKIQEHRQILPGIMDKRYKGNMAVMEAEDRFFKRITYARSLASFLKARGYSETDIQGGLVPAGVLEEGRTLAIQEAQKATFNDRNAFSDTIAKLGRGADKIPVIGTVISKGALPFLRTPANVVARAWDYSPMKLAETFYQVRKGNIDAATVIDQVSSSLTGTAAMALGAALAAGIAPDVELVGRIEDEDEKESGATEYSLRVGDKYYSVSWLSPTMIPLFIGANLYDKFQALGEENGMDGWGVAQAFMEVGAGVVGPMLELSMLSSLNDAIAAFAEEDDPGMGLLAALLNSATSYFTQGLPTIFGQAEQATETEKSSTYVNTDNKVEKVIKKALGNASRRIPGIDLFQTPRLDEFGQVVKNEGDGLERAFNAFLNPFNVSQKKTDPISQELSRLRKAGAENASIPLPQRTISYTDTDGEKHTDVRLSQEQFQKLAEKQGQTEQAVLSALLDSDDFRAMSDEVKDDVLAIVHSYAKETGELAAVENHLGYSATWMEELAEADDPAKYIVQRVAGTNLNRAMTDLDTAWDHSWNTTAKERALDEAYAEYKSMSKEAQKEIETFATGTAKKYLEARGNGISHKDFLAAAKNVETVKGTGKYNSETKKNTVKDIDKREAIAKTTGLTEHQVDIIMKAYMPDYDPDAEKKEKTELKYDYIRQELGMTPVEYADTYRAYLENAKKHEKIAAIQAMGYDYTMASKLYRLYQGQIDVVAWAGK